MKNVSGHWRRLWVGIDEPVIIPKHIIHWWWKQLPASERKFCFRWTCRQGLPARLWKSCLYIRYSSERKRHIIAIGKPHNTWTLCTVACPIGLVSFAFFDGPPYLWYSAEHTSLSLPYGTNPVVLLLPVHFGYWNAEKLAYVQFLAIIGIVNFSVLKRRVFWLRNLQVLVRGSFWEC